MPDPDAVEAARRLAAGGEDTAWFERLYAAAADGEAAVPWDRGGPHGLLVDWLERERPEGAGRRALVVGCGFGDDAEAIAARGFDTVAFDIAPTAIALARRRFPASRVAYRTADVLALPDDWRRAFDLVFESLTVQSLPAHLQPAATAAVSGAVAPGGTLLVLAAIRPEGVAADGPPWPLTRAGIDAFATDRLEAVRVEVVPDPSQPAQRRWRAAFRRPAD